MNTFKIELAGKVIDIEHRYRYVYETGHDFLADGMPDFSIKIENIDIERERTEYKAVHENYLLPDGYLESTAVLRKISDILIEHGILLMHGCVISINHTAFMFMGSSGTGKTMHLYKWLKNMPETVVINGDKPFVITGDEIMACGSPWAGKEKLYTNAIVPLRSIVLMERNEKNIIEQIPFSRALATLIQQTYLSNNTNKMKSGLSLLKSFDQKITFFRFRFNNFAEDAFQVAYDALCDSNVFSN